MGRMLQQAVDSAENMTVVARVDKLLVTDEDKGLYTDLEDFKGEADCLIDFSHHTLVKKILAFCKNREIPAVIATTAHTPEEIELIEETSAFTPIFFSANMSVGVALLANLAQRAAAAFPNADIEIVEIHHNQKLDVPSGTALMLARRIQNERPDSEIIIGRHENGKRRKTDIDILSLRLGNEVGTHEIYISTGSETITLRHKAESRALFADGAVKAAQFLQGKNPGLYDMRDILK